MFEVAFLDSAESDLDSISLYLAEFSQKTALEFLDELEVKIEQLKDHPYMYAGFYLCPKYRRFLVGKYVFLYTVVEEKKQIIIAHVRHGTQNFVAENL